MCQIWHVRKGLISIVNHFLNFLYDKDENQSAQVKFPVDAEIEILNETMTRSLDELNKLSFFDKIDDESICESLNDTILDATQDLNMTIKCQTDEIYKLELKSKVKCSEESIRSLIATRYISIV